MALRKDRPEPEAPADEIRHRIAAAARDLFAGQGYERTTVDAIAERAGVGRRTFFRHFPSKDDVLFPDHDRIVRLTAAHLAALDDVSPVRAVCSGARQVMRRYVADPVGAVQRYRLAGSVPALKAREIASVSEYVRLFSRYLRERLGDGPGVRLYSDVVAAATVAAHNQVLRDWLRGGGVGDPLPALDRALAWVIEQYEGREALAAAVVGGPEGTPAGHPAGDPAGEDVVVAVFRAGDPISDVVQRISRSL